MDSRGFSDRACVTLGQQPMDTCHADVVDALHVVPHQLGRVRSLFGDRHIRSARRNDRDAPLPGSDVCLTKRDDARLGVLQRLRNDETYRVVHLFGGARHEQC